MIRVRIAEASDQEALIEFIRDHWSPTHVFTSRPEVFAWQYGQADGRLNMVMAEDTGPPGRVLGVLGFIPMGRFSPDLGDRDLMLAIWKVHETLAPPGLGLRLLKFIESELSPRLIAAIGTSEMVRPIYRVLKYEVGALGHLALFRPGARGRCRIARNIPESAFDEREASGPSVRLVDPADDVGIQSAIDRLARVATPAKNWDYVVQRYRSHPWYRYELRALEGDGEVVALAVWRAVEAEGSRVLRLVDVVGDPSWLAAATTPLREELERAGAEYIDLMHWGVDSEPLEAAGFVSATAYDNLVLPNYFSPFESRRMEIEIAFKTSGDGGAVRLFRADSDQDRPNRDAEVDGTYR